MLVLQDVQLVEHERSLLGTFANQAALAVDRAQLSEQALRDAAARGDRPLAPCAGGRGLARPAHAAGLHQDGRVEPAPGRRPAGPEDRAELLELIELQSDRLARLVTNLLDMTRLEAGALELRPTAIGFADLVDEALASLGGILAPGRVTVDAPVDLPLLHLDPVLMSQVLANVLENADRLSPAGSVISVAARVAPGSAGTRVEIAVVDDGPGIAREERDASSRCSARTAAVAGPASAWPSPRPSSRPTAG